MIRYVKKLFKGMVTIIPVLGIILGVSAYQEAKINSGIPFKISFPS